MRILHLAPFLNAALTALLLAAGPAGAQPNGSLQYPGMRPETLPHNFKLAEDPRLRLKLGLPGQDFQQRGIVINWPAALFLHRKRRQLSRSWGTLPGFRVLRLRRTASFSFPPQEPDASTWKA